MKYCVLIIDGAAGLPLNERGNKTTLELAQTANLDGMAREGSMGLARTIPEGMEPSSACACLSILGYDPRLYYRGRSAIEAAGMGVEIAEDEVVFRCNLSAVRNGRMWSYSAGAISTEESRELIDSLQKRLGSSSVQFYPGISYRHLLKVKGNPEIIKAITTPPHDISDREVAPFMPKGPGGDFLKGLMAASELVLKDHPVNIKRKTRGDIPATTIWLFWESGQIPHIPSFESTYGVRGAISSGVDLLRGLARMLGMDAIDIDGVTDGLDNDYTAQINGALKALEQYDLVVVHVEAPDEAGHAGNIDNKIQAVHRIDREMVSRIRAYRKDGLKTLIMPDHPTPIQLRTHSDDPVPFLFWGPEFAPSNLLRFSEAAAKSTSIMVEEGFRLMGKLLS